MVAQFEADDPAATHRGADAAAGGFDFGKFGHGVGSQAAVGRW
jgi:hypothetical protein